MLSRVADSVYWMSRYVERAENVARFIDVNFQLMLDEAGGEDRQWQPLVNTSGDHEDFNKRYGTASQENVIKFLTFDCANSNSILSCLRKARENARTVREIISSEMWLQINRSFLKVKAAAEASNWLDSANEFFSEVKEASHLFTGITDATMAHNEAWHFCRLGRMLERADKTSRMLDVELNRFAESLRFRAVLVVFFRRSVGHDNTTSELHSGTRYTRDVSQNAGNLRGGGLSSGQALSPIAGPD